MKKSITPKQIKQNNQEIIFHYIYENISVSQQDISNALGLSRPTVTSKLNKLEEQGIIKKSGQIDSENVGRKAFAYSIVKDFRIAVGVELQPTECKILCVNLYGEYSHRTVININFQNNETYCVRICKEINAFIDSLMLPDDHILGIAISLPALVSPDGTEVTYGKILDCTGMHISCFREHLRHPCRFLHDAASAAISEMWASPGLTDAFYLLLSYHLGAAMITGGSILTGKHGHTATVEHLPLQKNGKKCYCGKRGCIDTLCSITALMESFDEDLDTFFDSARLPDTPQAVRWHKFLTDTAEAINYLHLVYDTDFILGGYLAPYFTDKDIRYMHEVIASKTPFEESEDFIHVSKMPKHNITMGGALAYIKKYLNY